MTPQVRLDGRSLSQLTDVSHLDSATGGEATVTLNELPSDSYAFRIVDNDTEEYNFSPNFDFEGTGEAPSTTTSEEETSTTETESSTTEETTTTTEEETTTTTEETSTTTDEETTTTPESTSFTTTSDAETTTPVSSTTTEGKLEPWIVA